MAAAKKSSSRGRNQDRARVAGGQDHEVRYEAKKTGAKKTAGKTDKDLRDNGWFAFFAPRDHPQIAGVVFLEHGVHGGNAALVVRHILDTFFAKKEGRPLPPKPLLVPNLNPSMG